MNLFAKPNDNITLEIEDINQKKRIKYKLGDFLNDIALKSGNLLIKDPDSINDLNIFALNRALSAHQSNILICDELNRMIGLNKTMQYAYLYGTIRRGKKFAPYVKPFTSDDLEMIKTYYNISTKKALIALDILEKKPNELELIRSITTNKGGI